MRAGEIGESKKKYIGRYTDKHATGGQDVSAMTGTNHSSSQSDQRRDVAAGSVYVRVCARAFALLYSIMAAPIRARMVAIETWARKPELMLMTGS